METITYRLNITEKSFYEELSEFTSCFLEARSKRTFKDVLDFVKFQSKASKSTDEHYLEYLTLGVLLNKYSSNALSSGRISMALLNSLYKGRSRYKGIKPTLEKLRGFLSTLFLNNTFNKTVIDSATTLKHFVKWLDATGEFSEESVRIKNWQAFLSQIPTEKQREILRNAMAEAFNFETGAKVKLGIYTENVKLFRQKHLSEHKFRENYIFCGRHEVEYHLNMFGAEILNRALQPGFQHTTKKVILLPTCMSNPADGKCKAQVKGSTMVCTACSPECNINIKRWEYSTGDTEVVLIPHSSEFTQFLKYWKNQDTVGLIGVACVLNLLKGGYEMQKLNIPSQCVFLDYCGCKNHWHKIGIPTDISEEQLQRVVG
jgi:hypothetical protein